MMSRERIRGYQEPLVLSGFFLLVVAGVLVIFSDRVYLDLYCGTSCSGGKIELPTALRTAVVLAGFGFALILTSISVGIAALTAPPAQHDLDDLDDWEEDDPKATEHRDGSTAP